MAGCSSQGSRQRDPNNQSSTFKCSNQTDSILKRVQTFYKDKDLFDVVLIAGIDSVKVYAHRLILSASSDYFLGMFRSALKEARSDVIELMEFDGHTLQMILDFMYTASIELRCETIENVLRAADFFQMHSLITACCVFLGQQLDFSNCLGITLFAEQLRVSKLYKKAHRFVCTHFEKVCEEQEFIELNEEQLLKFISCDDIVVHSEENMFRSVMAWIAHDKETREKCAINLLSHVRFPLLKPQFIIENRHLLGKSIEFDELFRSWLQWHASPESRTQFPIQNATPRETLAFISGKCTNNLKLQTFDVELNKWSYEEWPHPLRNRKAHCMAVVNKKIIIAGGFIGDQRTTSIECYDQKTKKWTELPPIRETQNPCAMVDLNGDLYVICRSYEMTWCAVEKYDFSTGQWEEVAPLALAQINSQLAVHDGLLYVVGYDDYWVAFRCYDPMSNQWTEKACTNSDTIGFDITTVGDYLYAVGGSVDGTLTKTVERYDPSSDTWTEVTPLHFERSHIKCVSFKNRLIACGGFDGDRTMGLVDEYDPETNEWTALAPVLPFELESTTNRLLTI